MSEIGGEVLIDVSNGVQKKINALPRETTYPHEDLLNEIPSGMGVKLLVPRRYFFGRQKPDEYAERKRLLAIKAFEEDPEGFLQRAPVIACLVPTGKDESRLIIIDGHHRYRESGRIKRVDDGKVVPMYAKVPTLVFTPAEMSELMNKSNHTINGARYTEQTLIQQLLVDSGETQDYFGRMPTYKHPSSIKGIATVEQLAQTLDKAA